MAVPMEPYYSAEVYDQRWALTLLEEVLARLQREYAAAGKARLFEELRVYLANEKGQETYSQRAGRLGISEGALKMAVSRLRRRYGELLRREIARTVGNPEEVEDELRALFRCFT